jgi:hypothetical protein
MPVEKHKNDMGGISWVVKPEDTAFTIPENLDSKITSEERALLASPEQYFSRLASEFDAYHCDFLLRVAGAEFTHFEINVSNYAPALSENFVGVRLPGNPAFLLGVRSASQEDSQLPPWLRPLYRGLNSTREEDWMVAGGFLRPGNHEPPPQASEWARSPAKDIASARIFFSSVHGDGLAYLPNGKCVWYLHETETLAPVENPDAVIKDALEHLLAGKKYRPPEDMC